MPLHRRPRRPADLTDTADTFPGFGRDGGVWLRPDHVAEPDAEPPLGPLERLGPGGSSAVAVLAVAALVGGLLAGFGHPAGRAEARDEPVPGVAQAAAAAPAPVPADAAAPAPVAQPAAGDVVVLDQGRTPAAAKALAGRLQSGGWRVTGTGAFHGRVPATTVYHPKGQEAAAKKLAAAFPEVRRVRPTFPGISQSRLVVIVVDDPAKPPLVSKVLGTDPPKR
ncbi:LytR C-terminal domain-containing protein [Yinghuangia soli]|uniref:LytR C-terminal domain-containing protein n=1 Tax=Yinghuangia soli TaxID=2908204 RepID=A0AA41Q0N9_9ACTN|nr:LytR C-terminal domain-containing protein [Yinghuangia soli]MCF2529399.1 LytR C-terminal domain-containing protein [Yinghuangia soli]